MIVLLLEPPLPLDCRWDEEEDTEDSAACPLGEGEGVSKQINGRKTKELLNDQTK